MSHKLIGSHTVEESTKIFAERAKARDAVSRARRDANKVSRNTVPDAPDTATNRGLPQPKAKVKKPKKQKVIKIDPNVKPIGRSVLPVAAVVDSLKSAFERFKAGAKAGASKGKQVAKAAGAKVKQAAQAGAAKPGEKTVVPLKARRTRNPGTILFRGRNDPRQVVVTPQKGFEKLAEEQGVPKKQSIQQFRGQKVGDRGPLLNALAKRKAAQARKANLGGSRADRSDARSRARPSLRSASPTAEQKEALAKIPTQQQVKAKKDRSKLAGRVVGGLVGGAIGVGAARKFK